MVYGMIWYDIIWYIHYLV